VTPRSSARGRLAAAAVLVTLLIPVGDATATFPGRNGKIAFVSTHDGGSAVWTVDPDGRDPRQLTPRFASAYGVSFSGDGRRIAFRACSRHSSWCGIYVMSAEGRQLRRVAHTSREGSEPGFSPDGRSIVFAAGRYLEDQRIYTIRPDGTEKRALAPGGSPTFSPDGRRIAFVRLAPDPKGTHFANSDLHVMDRDGGRVRRLTSNPASERDPAFSPDGRRIAFTAGGYSGFDAVYDMDAGGGAPRLLTNDRHLSYGPAFSPDGRLLVFSSADEVRVMNADGTRQRRIAAPGASPDWQPRR
jgi:Tol biopolymer transport system component